MSWVENVRNVVEGHTAQTVDYHTGQPCNKRDPNAVFLDATTANMLLTIHDNLSKDRRDKFAAFTLERAIDVGWKLIAKQREARV